MLLCSAYMGLQFQEDYVLLWLHIPCRTKEQLPAEIFFAGELLSCKVDIEFENLAAHLVIFIQCQLKQSVETVLISDSAVQ